MLNYHYRSDYSSNNKVMIVVLIISHYWLPLHGRIVGPCRHYWSDVFHFSKGLCEMSIYQNRWIQADHQREWVRIYSGMICSWNIIGHKFSIIFHVSIFLKCRYSMKFTKFMGWKTSVHVTVIDCQNWGRRWSLNNRLNMPSAVWSFWRTNSHRTVENILYGTICGNTWEIWSGKKQ